MDGVFGVDGVVGVSGLVGVVQIVAKWLLFSTEEYVNLVPLVPQTPIWQFGKV